MLWEIENTVLQLNILETGVLTLVVQNSKCFGGEPTILNIPDFSSQIFGKDTFRYSGAKLWDKLCNEMENTNSQDSFKNLIL